jgi:hypothetical protein
MRSIKPNKLQRHSGLLSANVMGMWMVSNAITAIPLRFRQFLGNAGTRSVGMPAVRPKPAIVMCQCKPTLHDLG